MDNINTPPIQDLLERILKIHVQYAEKAKQKGENFNIFKILKMETNEVKTHSAFLSELLNSKGSHGHNDLFLRLFIEQIKGKCEDKAHLKEKKQFHKITNFQTKNATTKPEYDIGRINEEKTIGGRIDILIKFGNDKIIIENKIDAPDQDAQLIRYHNYAPNSPLFYLTRWDDKKPNLISIKNNNITLEEGTDYICISYEKEINNWLEMCLQKVEKQEPIWLIIHQYKKLIENLTNQIKNVEMNTKIIELLEENPDLLEVFMDLPSKKDAKEILIKSFMKKVSKHFSLDFNNIFKKHENDSLNFKLKNGPNIDLYLSFLGKNNSYGDAYILIYRKSEKQGFEEIQNEINEIFGKDYKAKWGEGAYRYQLLSFGTDGKDWKNIRSNEKLKEVISDLENKFKALDSVLS